MSRLSNKQFLVIHDQLKRIWLNHPSTFARLSAADQFHLHLYFQPDSKLSATEPITHSQHITAEQPTLPQKAGRARVKLLAAITDGANPVFTGRTVHSFDSQGRPRIITVRAIMNPEPDTRLLVRVILDMTKRAS